MPKDKQELSVYVDQEVDRQITSFAQAESALTTQISLLITTAVIFVSLPLTAGSGGWGSTIASVFALIGAVLGVWALFRKRKGEEIDLAALEAAVWKLDSLEAFRAITKGKIETLDEDRERLKTRKIITFSGFASLVVSLIITVVQ